MDKLEVLKKSDVFHYLEDAALRVIAEMCTAEVFEPGAIICKQGKEQDKLYVIEEGLVGVFLELGPLDCRQIQAGANSESFGWSALIPPHLCTTTVKALERTRVFVFNGKDLCNLIDTDPRLYAKITEGVGYVVSQRLRAAFNQLMGVTYQD